MFNGTPPDYDPHRFDARPPAPIKKVRTTPEAASRKGWSQELPPGDFPGWDFVTYGAAVRAAESLEAIYTRVGQIVTNQKQPPANPSDPVADGLLRVYKAFRRTETRQERAGEWAERPVPVNWEDWHPIPHDDCPWKVRYTIIKHTNDRREREPDYAPTFGDLADLTADDWQELPNVGPATTRKVMEWLAEHVNTGPSPP